jgi:hypothetical protein
MPAEMAMTEEEADEAAAEGENEVEDADDHLAEVEDGAGCTEIWEHLSRRRTGDDD